MLIRYLDLFSGVGAFRHAVMRSCGRYKLNCRSVGFSEIDKNALKTYRANFEIHKDEIDFGDIANITGEEIKKVNLNFSDYRKYNKRINSVLPDIDMLFAGFPCQPFSLMGKGNGFADTRGTLFFHIERILDAKRPSFFLLENVRGLMTHDSGKTLDIMTKILEKKLGYSTVTWMLNSSDYGVPQTRRRIYILGFRDGKVPENLMKPPEKTDLRTTSKPTTWHMLERDVDKKYYLSDRIIKTILSNGTGNYYSRSEINPIIARPLCATMHKMHRASQDNYFSDRFIFGEYKKTENTIKENKRRKNRIRRITPKEAFRLHGFPDSFVKNAQKAGVSDTQLYRQAGNSVTVNVVEKIMNLVIPELQA